MKPSPLFVLDVQPQKKWWRFFSPFLLLLALPLAALGQANYATPYTFATLAGHPGYEGQRGFEGDQDGTGSGATFYGPNGVAVDGAGNIYVADFHNERVRKVTPTGVVTTLAGSNLGYADGANSAARFNMPLGVAVDGATNLYVADYGNNAIRKVTPVGTNWVVTTLAGGSFGINDGTGTNAQFYDPIGLAMDSATNLYVVDERFNSGLSSSIRKVTPAGVVTTLAGGLMSRGTNDGAGTNAQFYNSTGVGVDNATNLYVADNGNSTIRKVTPVGTNWVVITLAGWGGQIGSNDGIGSAAQFNQPNAVAVDSTTNLYVPDQGNNTIRKLTPIGTNWMVTTLAGQIGIQGKNDGTGTNAQFYSPAGAALDSAGNLYVADVNNETIRRGFLAGGTPVILTNGTGLAFSNGLFGFNLTAAAGQLVVVDASTDLVVWSSVWTNTVGTGVLLFSDPQSGSYSNCFYRAHLP